MEQDEHRAARVVGSEGASLASLSVDALVPAIDGLLFLVSRDGRILDFRSGTYGELYIDPSTFLGRSIAETLPPNASSVLLPVLASVGPGEAPVVSYTLPMPAGTQAFEARVLSLANDLCLAFVSHVTEKVQAERELHARHELPYVSRA